MDSDKYILNVENAHSETYRESLTTRWNILLTQCKTFLDECQPLLDLSSTPCSEEQTHTFSPQLHLTNITKIQALIRSLHSETQLWITYLNPQERMGGEQAPDIIRGRFLTYLQSILETEDLQAEIRGTILAFSLFLAKMRKFGSPDLQSIEDWKNQEMILALHKYYTIASREIEDMLIYWAANKHAMASKDEERSDFSALY